MNCAKFAQNSKEAVSGGEDRSIRFWSITEKNQIDIVEEAHRGAVMGVEYIEADLCIVSVGIDGSVRIWSTGLGKSLLQTIDTTFPIFSLVAVKGFKVSTMLP